MEINLTVCKCKKDVQRIYLFVLYANIKYFFNLSSGLYYLTKNIFK